MGDDALKVLVILFEIPRDLNIAVGQEKEIAGVGANMAREMKSRA